MKFCNILKEKYIELNEQVPANLTAMQEPVGQPFAPTPAIAVPPQASIPPGLEQETSPLTSEGEVFLVRLLKKALFMNPGDIDEKALKDLPEINENNAAEVLSSIINIMKKYSNTIDVEIEANK
jgi:hypothetical protein